jgi:hypothetical protein
MADMNLLDIMELMNEMVGFLENDEDSKLVEAVHGNCAEANHLVQKHSEDIKQYIQLLSQKVEDAEGDAQREETEEEFNARLQEAQAAKRAILGNISNLQGEKHSLEVQLLDTKKQMRGLKAAHSHFLDVCEAEQNARAKLALYANVTRLHWAAPKADGSFAGFVAADGDVRPFTLEANVAPTAAADRLWALMAH